MSHNSIIKTMMDLLTQYRISDFHLRSGEPLAIRANGDIITFPEYAITHDLLDDILRTYLDEKLYQHFCITNDIDFSITFDHQRFRANGYSTINGWAMVLRTIISDVPHIDDLGLPDAVHNILSKKSGLILVTGQAGSGKSTSLAAMVNKINRERTEHIVTIEDPIEFIHTPIKSIISQREVEKNTQNFETALTSALRQDPDIILIGELRSYETISMALKAAETGHLVLSTLHTSSVIESIGRIVDVFPPETQGQARIRLSQSLQLVMTQQLIKCKTEGRIGAFEIMIAIPAIRNLIRENNIVQIGALIQTGAKFGMITMEKYIEELEKKDLIEPQSLNHKQTHG